MTLQGGDKELVLKCTIIRMTLGFNLHFSAAEPCLRVCCSSSN